MLLALATTKRRSCLVKDELRAASASDANAPVTHIDQPATDYGPALMVPPQWFSGSPLSLCLFYRKKAAVLLRGDS